jgi:hypothetical protein
MEAWVHLDLLAKVCPGLGQTKFTKHGTTLKFTKLGIY